MWGCGKWRAKDFLMVNYKIIIKLVFFIGYEYEVKNTI